MKLSFATFLVSLAGLCFAAGVAVGSYEIFPYHHIKYVLNSVEAVIADRDRLLNDKPTASLAKRRYAGSGATLFDPQQIRPGFTLLSGFFEDSSEIRLIRLDGTIVQRWPVSFFGLFSGTDHIFPKEDVPASDWNAAVHGIYIAPDGSVTFNFDGKGTVKLDRCGNTLWTVARMTHHSIDRAADGTYWVPSRHMTTDPADAYPHFRTPYRDDTILHLSAEGAVLSETSLNRILIDNGLFSLLVSNGNFATEMREKDVLHLNDIEELKDELASGFPLFEVGDLLLSLRHLNLLIVVDPDDWTVKWYQIGPWLRQHDPDFQADGKITLLNNNSDDTKVGDLLGGSNLMEIQPHLPNGGVSIIYGDRQGQSFFTNTQGKLQALDNGNYLVAEYYNGRAFEINSRGDIVWQYLNVYDEQNVARISGAERYAEDYFDVQDWSCPQ